MAYSSDEGLSGLTQNIFSEQMSMPDGLLSDILHSEESWHFGDCEEVEVNATKQCLRGDEGKILEATTNNRDICLVTDEELEKRKDSRIPENTKMSTAWAVRVWKDWAAERNSKVKTSVSTEKTVNANILTNTDGEVNKWMAKFVVEIRKKEEPGKCYPPNSLYQLCCGLQRFMRNNGRPALNLFEDARFKHFQDSLDSEMKRLTGLGVGASVKEAAAFTVEQEEKLWALNFLGDQSPSVLLDTMVFVIGKSFALRSGQEHRNLKFSQLALEPASGKEPEKLVYTSFGEKNNLGGLKHRTFKRKRVEHYANEACPERCVVQLYKKYKGKCPKSAFEKDSFYLSPRRNCKFSDEVWFTANPVGKNTLGDTVKKICNKAGIEGQYTNHSLRATAATRGLEKGIPEKFVMERTGHRDVRSLQKYQRPDVSTKVGYSKVFDCMDSLDTNETDIEKEAKELSLKRVCQSDEKNGEAKKLCGDEGKKEKNNKVSFHNCTFMIRENFNVE